MSGVVFSCHPFPVFSAHSEFIFYNSKFSSMTAITNFIQFPVNHLLSLIFVSLRSFCYCHCRIFFLCPAIQWYSRSLNDEFLLFSRHTGLFSCCPLSCWSSQVPQAPFLLQGSCALCQIFSCFSAA